MPPNTPAKAEDEPGNTYFKSLKRADSKFTLEAFWRAGCVVQLFNMSDLADPSSCINIRVEQTALFVLLYLDEVQQ